MKRCGVRPYSGSEEFIFVSYCRQDKKYVFPIIEQMTRDGYRVWYDEGIEPGAEPPERIVSQLKRASICIAFLSEAFLSSYNCCREIHFALWKRKALITIMLEQVSFSLGMEMQLSAVQAIFKYALEREQDFFSKLYDTEGIKSCLGRPDDSVGVSGPEEYEENLVDLYGIDEVRREPISDKWFIEEEGGQYGGKICLSKMEGQAMAEYDFSFYSDMGGRDNNEDSYIAKRIGEEYLFAVADGLGGHEDGEVASRAAINAVKEHILKYGGTDIRGAVEFANEAVLSAQQRTNSRMKTTMAIAYVGADRTVFAHVGDTRVYAFRNGEIAFQTLDHSASQLAVSVGEIKAEDIRRHSDRNILTRALGAAERVRVDVVEVTNDEYDAILLCSDGFWEYVLESEMCKTCADSGTAGLWLYKMRAIQLDRAPEKCDNNTAIAVLRQQVIFG